MSSDSVSDACSVISSADPTAACRTHCGLFVLILNMTHGEWHWCTRKVVGSVFVRPRLTVSQTLPMKMKRGDDVIRIIPVNHICKRF